MPSLTSYFDSVMIYLRSMFTPIFTPVTSKDLRDLGFTLLESNAGLATYSFPEHLNHGGYKLLLQDAPQGHPVANGQIFSYIDPNGVVEPELVPDVSHLYFFMEQFPKK
jgi:hypothetical protein